MYPGETLKRIRLLKGFNQKGVAVKMGITQQAYSKLEKSRTITEEKMETILKVLEYSEKDWELLRELLPSGS